MKRTRASPQTLQGAIFFFNQKPCQLRTVSRTRKSSEDVLQAVRLGNAHHKVAAYLGSKDRPEDPSQITDNVNLLESNSTANAFRSASKLSTNLVAATLADVEPQQNKVTLVEPFEWDSQRLLYNKVRRQSQRILKQLSMFISARQGLQLAKKSLPNIPRYIEYQLLASWQELTLNESAEFRAWQTQACLDAAKLEIAKAAEKMAEMTTRAEQAAQQNADVLSSSKKVLAQSASTNRRPSTTNTSNLSSRSVSRAPENTAVSHRRDSRILGHDGLSKRSVSGATSNRRTSHMLNEDTLNEVSSEMSLALSEQQGGLTIKFLLSSKESNEKGWVYTGGGINDQRMITMLEWSRQRLHYSIKDRKEVQQEEWKRGYKVIPQVFMYGDRLPPSTHRAVTQTVNFSQEVETHKSLLPTVPQLAWNPNDSAVKSTEEFRAVWQTISYDGSSVLFYPSGHVAIMLSHYGIGRQGFTFHAFLEPKVVPKSGKLTRDKTVCGELVASFTALGFGSVLHMENGQPRFTNAVNGCWLQDINGAILKKYSWPKKENTKLPYSIIFKINDFMAFKCVSKSDIVFSFTHGEMQANFQLGWRVEVAMQIEPEDASPYLLSQEKFKSQSAKDLLKPQKSKQQKVTTFKKPVKKLDKFKLELQELQKTLESELETYDSDFDKFLARIRRKVRNKSEEWLEHYRVNLDLMGNALSKVASGPRMERAYNRPVKSAAEPYQSINLGVDKVTIRAPSAPPGKVIARPFTAVSFVHFNRISAPPTSLSIDTVFNAEIVPKNESEDLILSFGGCPVSLRAALLGWNAIPSCHCSRFQPPVIGDLEYDTFISDLCPSSQLLIVIVIDSRLEKEKDSCYSMLEGLYRRINGCRPTPCPLSRHDPHRVVIYDIAIAANNTPCTQSLLLRRHNIRPGVCLMYQAGRLLFANSMFNGYAANRLRNFYQQLNQCKEQALRGFSLPVDFRFSMDHASSRKDGLYGSRMADSLDLASLQPTIGNDNQYLGVTLPKLKSAQVI